MAIVCCVSRLSTSHRVNVAILNKSPFDRTSYLGDGEKIVLSNRNIFPDNLAFAEIVLMLRRKFTIAMQIYYKLIF